jgi:hypothetical protein
MLASQPQTSAIPAIEPDVEMTLADEDRGAPDRTSTSGIKRKAEDVDLTEEGSKKARTGAVLISITADNV